MMRTSYFIITKRNLKKPQMGIEGTYFIETIGISGEENSSVYQSLTYSMLFNSY